MGEVAIAVEDVAKRFRLVHERNTTLKAAVFSGFKRTVHEEFWALDGVTFDVPSATTFGLIGHNGSGKSTLLKCMAQIYRPDRGSITTRGRVSALLELGAGFHPELSGRENVFLNASILGMSRRETAARFEDIVEFAGLGAFIDTPVKNYSSGMFVRLGFSVAITVEPEVLLVDEVLAVGDESFQQRCLEKFADLREAGHTVVVVSHGLDTVRNMCDQVAWLDHGHLLRLGPADEVVEAYLESVREDSHARLAGGSEDHESGWAIQEVTVSTDEVRHGGALVLHVRVLAPRDERITMAISCNRTDGVHVANGSHVFEVPASIPTDVAYSIPSVPMGAGSYTFNVRLLDEHRTRTHAVHTKAARFDVLGSPTSESGGLVALDGRWEIATSPADHP